MTKTVSGTTTIEAQYAYDAYGIATKLQGSQDADFQYAGYFMHARSGLNLTLTRQYSAALGRWISKDLILEAGGVNLYQYVANNPLRFKDPSGEFILVAAALPAITAEAATAIAGGALALGIAGKWIQDNGPRLGRDLSDSISKMNFPEWKPWEKPENYMPPGEGYLVYPGFWVWPGKGYGKFNDPNRCRQRCRAIGMFLYIMGVPADAVREAGRACSMACGPGGGDDGGVPQSCPLRPAM